jgi:hypothetical protein
MEAEVGPGDIVRAEEDQPCFVLRNAVSFPITLEDCGIQPVKGNVL